MATCSLIRMLRSKLLRNQPGIDRSDAQTSAQDRRQQVDGVIPAAATVITPRSRSGPSPIGMAPTPVTWK